MAAVLLVVLPSSALSVGSVSTVSPRPMAMGGAFMAVDDELAAMVWNPAGFVPATCGSGVGFRLHVNILGAPAIARETGLLTGVESEPFAFLPAIEKLSIALGSIVKGATVRTGGLAVGALMLEEHLDSAGLADSKGLADASDLLGAYYTTFAFAFQLAPSVTIGASEIVLSGWDAPGRRKNGTGRAYGALMRPNDKVTVGLTYLDLPNDFEHYRLDVEGLGSRTMNAGVAYRPVEDVLLTFDLRDLSEKHPETSLEPRVGFEWNLWGRGALRAGAYREDGGETNVLTLGMGSIRASACMRGGRTPGGDSFVLNYTVLLKQEGTPRHLLSVLLHF
ncbi:MAG: hypothetical protein ABIE42_01735 [Candidatus Eisenbacteria bacterium]